jgi:hypothetical protein
MLPIKKISTGFLALALLAGPQMTYADWGFGIRFGGPGPAYHEHFYRWHEHPHWGLQIHYLPEGCITVWAGGARYFYYDGLYYSYVRPGIYVLVAPPIGAYVSAIPTDFQAFVVNGRTYYTDNGIYYVLTRRHGYKVVAAPVVYVQPAPVVTGTVIYRR